MRFIDLELQKWIYAKNRKPLLIRGARQVGKTFAVERLCKEHFPHFCKIDFEQEPELKEAFSLDLDPKRILKDLSSRKNIQVIPGKTLVFFDEIQACPKAIMALRYFYEQMPELHVIAAGSLLEFILGDANFSFPVGRLQTLYVRPFSFNEFLQFKGEFQALEWIKTATIQNPIGPATHLLLLRLLKEYFISGGMPAVLYKTDNIQESRIEQRSILEMYSNDFRKYAKHSAQKYLQSLFDRAPYLVGEHFKYAKVDPHMDSRELKIALEMLGRSGLIHRIYHSSCIGVPLGASLNEKKCKLLFLDIGLLNSKMNIPLDFLVQEDLSLVHSGALAEQFVGQELIAYQIPYYAPELFYWEREKKGSDAEVDYVLEIYGKIVPVEVKAGKTGRLRSLHQFLQEKQVPLGIRISTVSLSQDNTILSIPLYMISEISRLVQELKHN